MKAVLVLFALAMFAMASAQGNAGNPEQGNFGSNRPRPVHFVNNNRPGNVNFVNNNPSDPTSVNFVNNNPSDPTSVNFVDNNPSSDPTSVNFVNNNPSDPTAVHVVDNNPGSQVHVVDNYPGQVILNNPDSAFYRPSQGTPDISPVYAPSRPGKQYPNPYLRDGK